MPPVRNEDILIIATANMASERAPWLEVLATMTEDLWLISWTHVVQGDNISMSCPLNSTNRTWHTCALPKINKYKF